MKTAGEMTDKAGTLATEHLKEETGIDVNWDTFGKKIELPVWAIVLILGGVLYVYAKLFCNC